jgi:hypothetical protein
MSVRHVYAAADVEHAGHAVAVAHRAGVVDGNVTLVARSDIERCAIPDDMKLAETDFVPAAARGAGYGAAAGVVAGLAAAAVPPLGVPLAGAMIGGGAAGMLVGAWSSSLVGATVPEPVRRRYEQEIEAGRILVVLDAEDEAQHASIAPHLRALGLVRLDALDGVEDSDVPA